MSTFDFTKALPKRSSSLNTQRAYYRWVDHYLEDVAGLKGTQGAERIKRMEDLPLKSFLRHLSARKFRNWLDKLADYGQSRQTLDQARASIVTLAELLAEAGVIDRIIAAEIQSVSVPAIKKNPSSERILNPDELKILMNAAREMATSPQQMLRNDVIATMLCTLALRREELSAAKWANLSLIEGGIVILQTADSSVEIPRSVLNLIDRWRSALANPTPQSPLIRRIWKGGRISKGGLSPDGIWLIIRDAAQSAGLGHVTPDDLRRSAAVNMYKIGIPIEEISKLLRHRSVLITERFLAKLPLNEVDEEEA